MTNLSPFNIQENKPIVIAGPCSAESREQVLDTARQLSRAGVRVFRAGIWKPRTKPGSFEGVGSQGLEWLREAKAETGMLTAVEVANREHVAEALSSGVDILWIGARTTTNPFAVQEIADALEDKDTGVLVKNPVMPDIDLWIGAIERLYNAGVRRLGAIHRGFGHYGNSIYRNPPQWAVPIELKRRMPSLTLICDPSHIAGNRELIAPLAQQALDMNYDGLMIESHCNPHEALSDASQQLTPAQLRELLASLVIRGNNVPNENITLLREQIDRLDAELIETLARRMAVSREIGAYKRHHSMSAMQTDRYDALLTSRLRAAEQAGMSADFMKAIMSAIHEESINQQLRILNSDNKEMK